MAGKIDETFEKIIECLKKSKNFCLDAGAGAGKTYTLIETIKYIKHINPTKKIICITFTNNAKDEILSRLDDTTNVYISTIHDFIWMNICKFQSVLRTMVNELINDKILKYKAEVNLEKLDKYENADLKLPISYRDFESVRNGIISHDTLLTFFVNFLDNTNYQNLLFSSIDYIFIDEYQDTNNKIFDKFCSCLINYQKENGKVLIGLFGDYMQNIYLEGIGNLNDELKNAFQIIKKTDNFRSSDKVIKFNNCMRNDLKQICRNTDITSAPIMFIYNYSDDSYLKKGYQDYKRLHLTHRVISEEIGFKSIYEIYSRKYGNNTSNVLKNADERFLRYICKEIMPSIHSFIKNEQSNIIKCVNLNYFNFESLNMIKTNIDKNVDKMEEKTILEFLNDLYKSNLFDEGKFSNICQSFNESEDSEFLEEILSIPAVQFYNYYIQYVGETMLETMHGTKGNEFDNVLINIQETTSWNWYNFSKLLKQEPLKETVQNRTYKLLYVACTRAKKSVIINYIVDKEESKNKLAGENMIVKIKSLWGDNIECEILE